MAISSQFMYSSTFSLERKTVFCYTFIRSTPLVSPGMAWLAWSTFARCPLSLKCHVNIPPKIIKIVATQVKMTPIGLIGFKPHTRQTIFTIFGKILDSNPFWPFPHHLNSINSYTLGRTQGQDQKEVGLGTIQQDRHLFCSPRLGGLTEKVLLHHGPPQYMNMMFTIAMSNFTLYANIAMSCSHTRKRTGNSPHRRTCKGQCLKNHNIVVNSVQPTTSARA